MVSDRDVVDSQSELTRNRRADIFTPAPCFCLRVKRIISGHPITPPHYVTILRPCAQLPWAWLSAFWALDFIFLVDIYLRLFHFSVSNADGEELFESSAIAAAYIRSRDIWWDVLASVPIEAILLVPTQVRVGGRGRVRDGERESSAAKN